MKLYFSIKYVIIFALVNFLVVSCDKGLEDLNQDPNSYDQAIPDYLFTKAQLDAVDVNYFGTAALTIGGSMQQFATYKEVPASGDKYFNDNSSKQYFEIVYPNAVNEIEEVIEALLAEETPNANKLSIARIWRVYIFHRITDLYGDIPYTEAAKGDSEQIFTPKYDEQSFIYEDLFNELEEAISTLDSQKSSYGAGDLIYGGNTDQWKKFGYSLMLRLGMRLTKVDPQMAETWVKKAIDGGVITESEDVAFIEYTDGSEVSSRNPIARGLMDGDYIDPQSVENVEGGKYAKTFIDYLKETEDPRLNVISVVWVDDGSGLFVADTTSAIQRGMPNAAFNNRPDDFETYSEPHPETILAYDSPLIVMSSAEVNLLLTEAVIRGWYSGDDESLYESAVLAGMEQWALYGGDGVISNEQANKYLDRNPYVSNGSFDDKMEQIQTQKWVSLFLDEYEIFSNWRRTGYPNLTPVNYPGNLTGGKIPRRFVLPDSESTINAENFQEAVDRQGTGNSFLSRVWWDIP